MWHGGGLSGVTWETKPDGKPGWQNYFLKAGHDVYVSDAVERGRASWARYPEIFKTEPFSFSIHRICVKSVDTSVDHSLSGSPDMAFRTLLVF